MRSCQSVSSRLRNSRFGAERGSGRLMMPNFGGFRAFCNLRVRDHITLVTKGHLAGPNDEQGVEDQATFHRKRLVEAVSPTFTRVAASRTSNPFAHVPALVEVCPRSLLRAMAEAKPAGVRPWTRPRSNWPSAPKRWKTSRPPGVAVSMAFVSDRDSPPRFGQVLQRMRRAGRPRP